MILRKAGAALAAGCTMIVKPSPETPLSVLALAYLAEEAGFPKGVFSVLTTSLENTPELSEALCKHPLVKKVTFTGSVCILSYVSLNLRVKESRWERPWGVTKYDTDIVYVTDKNRQTCR